MPNRYYHFKGNSEDIINSVLSLLVGKEYYQEPSFYSNFLNDSQSLRYQKKIRAVLDLMQKENLILIREDSDELGGITVLGTDKKIEINGPSKGSRVYLRQHGKQVLSEGGYKRIPHSKTTSNRQSLPSSVDSKLALLIFFSAGILCSI
ncbi:MAG TPA: hypothetical protein VK809_06210 [Bacteroidia bacterium]|jgi:hypothetical protein|nr:hypothetical protein [Bacteroidia bacterium]